MARLRKAAAPSEPAIAYPPPATATVASRSTRSSPRKLKLQSQAQSQPFNEISPRRSLRYTSQLDSDDENASFVIPKLPRPDGDTPRKQRVLRTVASNSRLLRKLSNESLASFASPEKERRNGTGVVLGHGRELALGQAEKGLGYMYSKQLARTMAARPATPKTERKKDVKAELSVFDLPIRDVPRQLEQNNGQQVDDQPLDEDEEADQSLWCGDDAEEPATQQTKREDLELLENPHASEDEDGEDEDGEDEDGEDEDGEDEDGEDEEDDEPVMSRIPRNRQHRRAVQSDSDDEEDEADEVVRSRSSSLRQDAPKQTVKRESVIEVAPLLSSRPPHRKGKSTISNWAQEVIDLTASPEAPPMTRPSSSDGEAVLIYSPTPTKQRSPRKAPPISRPSTPPLAPPSPSKLVSPSKKKNRIPQAPDLRPSLDAFWGPDVVNTWNDEHSPHKVLVSPRKQKWLKELNLLSDSESDDSFPSPTTSPKKKNTSPASPVKIGEPSVSQIRAQRKAFAERKHKIAQEFLAKIDTIITGGKIAEMSAATGGIKLVWSRTLKTTAGRANWRREQLRLRTGPLPTDIKVEYRHHCSIELAEKVIDDEERLYNVLAHEYCHLTTFMISCVRNNPHGAEFKAWGANVTKAFCDEGVEVTTKHSYKIDYKYVWECIACGYEFKRHSRSVDPGRHSCGKCKGKLVQTKPTPRAVTKGANGAKKERGEYQTFVKENFASVKLQLKAKGLDSSMGKVMEAVAKEYRERKAASEVAEKGGVVQVEELFEGLKIQDEDT